jgi:Secretion system C-terminal sorting domain
VGALGQSFICAQDNLLSPIIPCLHCGGDGILAGNDCDNCDGTGIVHSLCGHAYEGGSGNTVLGPIDNFAAIDTSAVQVMATYQYLKTDRIRFRYGAKTNNFTSNGAGIRLNSTWFREFSLTPALTTLPIKLSSFTAMLVNTKADLKWTTSYEKDVNYFAIEKSTDGKNFSQIGMVFAKGNSTENNSYTYPDASINTTKESIVYYRLRSVDIDGKSQVSEVKLIRVGKQNEQIASIVSYPNPVVNELRVTIPTTWQGKKVSYEVLNNNGQSTYRKEIGSSSQTETIAVSQLAPGFYIIKVSCNGEVAQQKIIKK